MSLIFPKKEILYAPMLGTLGGGSARGFGRGGGGGYPDPIYTYAENSSIEFHNGYVGSVTNQGQNLSTNRTLQSGLNAYQYSVWGNNTTYWNITINGYQDWLVPVSGKWKITCRGAKGGNNTSPSYPGTGGAGGITRAIFTLPAGSSLRIIAGSSGSDENGEGSGGGGGGSFVFYGTGLTGNVNNNNYGYGSADSAILSRIMIASGGGGGAAHNSTGGNFRDGTPAYAGTESIGGSGRANQSRGWMTGEDSNIQSGHGENGNRGQQDRVNGSQGNWSGGGGAGILQNGEEPQNNGSYAGINSAGKRYNGNFEGGYGGYPSYGEPGGFGGGSRGGWGGSGGGGYSGGAGDYSVGNNADASAGGGGGNFINTNFSINDEGYMAQYESYDLNTNTNNSSGRVAINLVEAF